MKRQMTLRSLLVIICLLLGLNLHAQVVTIHVGTAGTLSSYITSNDKYLITSLTLTGDLNGTDIRYIREMAGIDVTDNATSGKLSVLDISDANIVEGGDYYYFLSSSPYIYSDSNTVGRYMFTGTRLTTVTIPNSVTSIGSEAFRDCSRLTTVTIPNSVISIGNYAFWGCGGLTSVTIPNSVTSIGYLAFEGCSGLTSVTIGNGITSIGDCAFYNCRALSSITIGSRVTSIDQSPSSDRSGLTSISNPDSITSMGDITVGNYRGIAIVLIRKIATYRRITSVLIPKIATSIGYGAFSGCRGLLSITIGNSVTSIGSGAFSGCRRLSSVTIPNSITSIGEQAFARCSGFKEIHTMNAIPQKVKNSVFNGIDKKTCTLYVPKDSYSSYSRAEGWCDFATIIEED